MEEKPRPEEIVLHCSGARGPVQAIEMTVPISELHPWNQGAEGSEEPPSDDPYLLKWCALHKIPKMDHFRAIVIVTAAAYHILDSWDEVVVSISISYANIVWVLEEYIRCLGPCISQTLADLRNNLQQTLAPLAVNKAWKNKAMLLEKWIMDSKTELYVRCCNIVKAIVCASRKHMTWLLASHTHATMVNCVCCGRLLATQTTNKGFRCGRCKGVLYCNRNCQEKDWPRHQKYCKEMKLHIENCTKNQGTASMVEEVRKRAKKYSKISDMHARIFAHAHEVATKYVAQETMPWNIQSVEIFNRLRDQRKRAESAKKHHKGKKTLDNDPIEIHQLCDFQSIMPAGFVLTTNPSRPAEVPLP